MFVPVFFSNFNLANVTIGERKRVKKFVFFVDDARVTVNCFSAVGFLYGVHGGLSLILSFQVLLYHRTQENLP